MIPLLAALLLSAPVDDDVKKAEIHFMPPGHVITMNKVEARGFFLGEYLLLLKMDSELWDALQDLELYKDLDEKYQEVLEQKDTIIGTLTDDKVILNARSMRLETRLFEVEDKYIANAGGPIWPYILAIVGVTVGAIMLGIGTGMTIDAAVKG